MTIHKGWLVTQEGNIKDAFLSKDSAEEYKMRLENLDFEDAKNELGFNDDLSENDTDSIAFQAGNDSGSCEIYLVDLDKHNENESIYLGQDEFSFDEIETALQNAKN